MKKRTNRLAALFAAMAVSVSLLAGCAKSDAKKEDTSTASAASTATEASKDEIKTTEESKTDASAELYFTQQEKRKSPEWVTKLDAAKDAEQLIVVAGVDKTTAYVTMHEKNADGEWEQIIATPGFIGLDGLGAGDFYSCHTPVGTYTIYKAFGLADDPGCQMEYTKVDENYYWSADEREGMYFNELVDIREVPDLDLTRSEHIADYDYAYQYVLDMGYNRDCIVDKGCAFFFHSFRINRPYTGGCVAVPENIMKFIMQHVKPGCKITIDSLKNFGGDLDA